MPRSLMAPAALALALGLGVGGSLAHAQDGRPSFPRTPPGATELPPGQPAVDSSPSRTPVLDKCRYGRPLGCWGSFNSFSCGSLRSELAFIFGSCRTFFGEPCLKGAPPSPLPPWAGSESGYHPPADRSANPPAGKHGWRLFGSRKCASCDN